ncbi:MAG TPA: hypothetical protein VFS31_05785, partial [Chitinophagaceae bacterium]|nr:hypothetical protein [Chitinophagaceae bacterium]
VSRRQPLTSVALNLSAKPFESSCLGIVFTFPRNGKIPGDLPSYTITVFSEIQEISTLLESLAEELQAKLLP